MLNPGKGREEGEGREGSCINLGVLGRGGRWVGHTPSQLGAARRPHVLLQPSPRRSLALPHTGCHGCKVKAYMQSQLGLAPHLQSEAVQPKALQVVAHVGLAVGGIGKARFGVVRNGGNARQGSRPLRCCRRAGTCPHSSTSTAPGRHTHLVGTQPPNAAHQECQPDGHCRPRGRRML